MVVASKRKVQFERTTSINDDVDGSLEPSKQKKESSGSSQCCSSAPRAKALSFAAFPWTKNWPKASSLLLLRGGKEEAEEEGDLDGEARLVATYHGVVAGRLLQRCSLGPTRLRRRRLRQTCSSKIAQDLSEKSHRAPPYPTTAYNEDRTTCVVVVLLLLCSVDDLIYLLRFRERPPTKRRKRQQRGLLKKKKKK